MVNCVKEFMVEIRGDITGIDKVNGRVKYERYE